MTELVMAGHSRPKDGVASARLRPAIHVFLAATLVKTWMPGTSPGMTSFAITAGLMGCISSQTLRLKIKLRDSRSADNGFGRPNARKDRQLRRESCQFPHLFDSWPNKMNKSRTIH